MLFVLKNARSAYAEGNPFELVQNNKDYRCGGNYSVRIQVFESQGEIVSSLA